jgi:hypothetical protein
MDVNILTAQSAGGRGLEKIAGEFLRTDQRKLTRPNPVDHLNAGEDGLRRSDALAARPHRNVTC